MPPSINSPNPLVFRPPARADVRSLASRLTEADMEELEKLERTPKQALTDGLKFSDRAFTVLLRGRPIAMAGRVPFSGEFASVWLLAAPEARLMKKSLMRLAPRWLRYLHGGMPTLRNAASLENTESWHLIEHLGFEREEQVEVNGHPFQIFSRTEHV